MNTSILPPTGSSTLSPANPPPDIGGDYSSLEHVPGLDLSPLADEDLSGNWWKRYDPPNELIWTDGDRYCVREISGGDCLGKLEGVLQQLRDEFVEEQKSDAAGLAPEVVPPPRPAPTKAHRRPKLVMSPILTNTEHVVELESLSVYGSAVDSRSPSSPSLVKPKQHLISGSRVSSPHNTPLPASPRTVVGVPTSPRTDKIKRFWNKRTGENGCSSCTDDHKSRMLVILACQHKYCHGCLEKLIKAAVQNESLWPPRCCIQDIPLKTIRSTLSGISMQAFNNKTEEYAVSTADRIYCPRRSCSAWIPPNATGRITCKRCTSDVCRTCKGFAHTNEGDCPGGFGLQSILEGGRQGPRRCFQCRSMVEGTLGCNQMICKCNAEFCYICGVVWKTCACPPGEERHLQSQHGQGDAERAAQEIKMAQEEESRLAEQERTMGEKWLQMVEAKYDCLTKEMDSLYGRQWFSLGERHWHERNELESERILREGQMVEKLATDMKLLNERRRKEMDKQRILLQRERETLRIGQATEEDEYWFSLQSYLKGRENKEERQKTLMEKFTASQAEQMNVLHQQQQRKLTELNTRLEAQQASLECTGKRACEAEKEIHTTNIRKITRHQYSDTKWFEVIKIVRQSRLVELKEEEKVNDDEKGKFLESIREPVELQ